jgi:hypothetical protein
MVTIDADNRLRVFQYKLGNRETADEKRTVVTICTAGLLVVGFEMCRFPILSLAGVRSFQMKFANRKGKLYLCFVKHQNEEKKFERRTLEVHLLVFALTVDGF